MDDRSGKSMDAPSPADGAPAPGGAEWPTVRPPGHVVMFWLLASMAMLIFAPCVLLPVWIHTERARAYEQRLATDVVALEQQVAQNEEHVEALRTDPLVTDRLIRRELNQRGGEERVVAWQPGHGTALRAAEPPAIELLEPPDTPAAEPPWIARVRRWLPNWPYRRLFAEHPNRTLMLLMSGGLLATAFFLYGKPIAQRAKSPGSAQD